MEDQRQILSFSHWTDHSILFFTFKAFWQKFLLLLRWVDRVQNLKLHTRSSSDDVTLPGWLQKMLKSPKELCGFLNNHFKLLWVFFSFHKRDIEYLQILLLFDHFSINAVGRIIQSTQAKQNIFGPVFSIFKRPYRKHIWDVHLPQCHSSSGNMVSAGQNRKGQTYNYVRIPKAINAWNELNYLGILL